MDLPKEVVEEIKSYCMTHEEAAAVCRHCVFEDKGKCRLHSGLGFPSDWKQVVSDTQAYKQFGNSVPTKMIEAVAVKMLEALYGIHNV